MTQSHFGGVGGCCCKPCVMDDALARPESQAEARLQINEYNSPMLELFTCDALGSKAQPITVEVQRNFKIINADSDDGDSWLHAPD